MLAVAARGNSTRISKHVPLWVVNLGPGGPGAERNFFRSRIAIEFADSDTLVVAWFVSQQPKSAYPATRAKLEAVYLDAKSGKQKFKYEWSGFSSFAGAYGTADGNLLVHDEQTIRLFSPSLKGLPEKAFPMARHSAVTVSPGGRRVLVCPTFQDGSQAQLLDADTLQVIDTFPANRQCRNYALGDEFLAMWSDQAGLSVRSPGEPWRPVPIVLPTNRTNKMVHESFSFLNDTTLAGRSGFYSRSVLVATIEGKTLVTMSQPNGRELGSLVTSREDQYFGVVEERLRGLTIEPLDMYAFPSPEQFVVYSLSDMNERFRVKVEGLSPWSPKRLVQRYAISPDGAFVAVMSNSIIRTYAVR